MELHKIGNIVWKYTKHIKHIILSYFDNLQVRSLVRTGIFLFYNSFNRLLMTAIMNYSMQTHYKVLKLLLFFCTVCKVAINMEVLHAEHTI